MAAAIVTKATLTFDETQIKFSEKAKQAVSAAGGKFIQSEAKKFLPKKFNEQNKLQKQRRMDKAQ